MCMDGPPSFRAGSAARGDGEFVSSARKMSSAVVVKMRMDHHRKQREEDVTENACACSYFSSQQVQRKWLWTCWLFEVGY